MSGRMIFAPTTEMFLWNAGGGVPYKSASERKQIILNVQGEASLRANRDCATARSAADSGLKVILRWMGYYYNEEL